MNIGFDAKRAYHNGTGLGHYSRTLIRSLAEYFPQHQYFLFNPKPSGLFLLKGKNIHEVLPSNLLHKTLSSVWRSKWINNDLEKKGIDIYHGLSNEIPLDIDVTDIKSVVTIHDVIFERFPRQYSKIDVEIYKRKFRYACHHADKVIAISEQTKKDIMEFYKTPEEKIAVCYQSCNPAFGQTVNEKTKQHIKEKYSLPDQYFLYVGSIIERKNLLGICKAIYLLRNELAIPLVVIGDGTKYKQQVKDFIRQMGLDKQIIFLSDNPLAKAASSFLKAEDFPAIYQSAIAMIYPSFFEGFGIPVLEAMACGTPVVTSREGSLEEVAGEAAYFVDPENVDSVSHGLERVWKSKEIQKELQEKGLERVKEFSWHKTATETIKVYEKILGGKS